MKLVYGVGITDVPARDSSGMLTLPYKTWTEMLRRCYSDKFKLKNNSYVGCQVCTEWKTFSNFKVFFEANYHQGWHLDKDLLSLGCKLYSPETSIFIPREINLFAKESNCQDRDLPIGVDFNKQSRKYRSRIGISGKLKHLGVFTDAESAHAAWFKEKINTAKCYMEVCNDIHPNLYSGLIKKIESLKLPDASNLLSIEG